MDQQEQVSKTRRKREAHALQHLGEELVRLTEAQLQQLALPEPLLGAVLEAKRISKFGALRRQLQYVGRLMRELDAEAISAQLEAWKGRSRDSVAAVHLVERWRTRLLASEDALTEFATAYPNCDVQRLRTLIRNARKEQADESPPRSFRELFQAIKAMVELTNA
jgi:ribosome-associated protein